MPGECGLQNGTLQLTILPGHVHHNVSAGLQTSDLSLCPHPWQCRQQLDRIGMTLQQHLRHTGRVSEIRIHLEGRMRAEQIHVHTTAGPIVAQLLRRVGDGLYRTICPIPIK